MRPSPQALLALFFAAIIGIIGISFLFAQTRQPRKSVSKTPPKRAATQADSLNNLGVGYMNQQQFARALKYFQQAYAANPKLLSARLNQGIALLNWWETRLLTFSGGWMLLAAS